MSEVDPMEVIAVCGECGSEQNTQRMEKDIFLEAGHPAVCRLCGGVVILVERADKEHALRQINQRRGV